MKELRELKPLRDLRNNKLMLHKQEVSFSFIRHLNNKKIDYDIWLPTKQMNLQRGYVWELYQKRELIMSILLRRFIPHISIIQRRDPKDVSNGDYFEIIDGKQRLLTMQSFFNNKFTLLLEGNEYYFKDLPEDYQAVIGGHHILAFVVYDEPNIDITDQEKIDWFCMINFGGTPQDLNHLHKLKDIEEKKPLINNITPKVCKHKNKTAEFMGNGFLTTCDDCGKTLY